jgi:hypothetical protein
VLELKEAQDGKVPLLTLYTIAPPSGSVPPALTLTEAPSLGKLPKLPAAFVKVTA